MSHGLIYVTGAPRTKKTHNELVMAGGRRRVMPSRAWRKWCVTAQIVGNADRVLEAFTWPLRGRALPRREYNCRAMFYRDARRGDAVGFYQGLADLLEKRGVLVNDSCITQWDGSRLLVDRKHPRVELILSEVA